MDIDRDPKIVPEWKGDSYPHIEITEVATGKVLQTIEYFGAAGGDGGALRDQVQILWRADSKAFALTIRDRFYSDTTVSAMDATGKFVDIAFPSYKEMTGFSDPDPKDLRPRGWAIAEAWDKKGHLVYGISFSPEASYTGKDPLNHKIVLEVTATGMKCLSIPHSPTPQKKKQGKALEKKKPKK